MFTRLRPCYIPKASSNYAASAYITYITATVIKKLLLLLLLPYYYLCYKFRLFGIIINNYLIVLLDCKHSFPYNLKNLVRLTVIFIRIFPDIVSSYDDDEMSRVAHNQGKVISIFALKTSDHYT